MRRAVFSFRNDIGLPELPIANNCSELVFNLTMCPLRSSTASVLVFLTSNDSAIAITKNYLFGNRHNRCLKKIQRMPLGRFPFQDFQSLAPPVDLFVYLLDSSPAWNGIL